jgi:hypothetical protein
MDQAKQSCLSRSSQVGLWIAKTRSSRRAEQERPVPSEIRQMSASDVAQGKVIVNPERLTVSMVN